MFIWLERRWEWILVAGLASLALLGTSGLPHARLLSPYCSGTAPVRKIFIEARKSEFVPNEINVTRGECIELWIRHTHGVAHNAVIEGTSISSEGAPLFDHHGRYFGRALARTNPHLSPVMLREGWFGQGEQVMLRFQAMKVSHHRLQCTVAESIRASGLAYEQAQMMAVSISVSQ